MNFLGTESLDSSDLRMWIVRVKNGKRSLSADGPHPHFLAVR